MCAIYIFVIFGCIYSSSSAYPTKTLYPEEKSGYFEGDIILSPSQKNGLRNESYRWPNAEVVYFINATYTDEQIKVLHEAFEDYHKYTCIKFRPKIEDDVNYISIQNTKGDLDCSSRIGMIGGKQVLNLGAECFLQKGTVIHELMHALGFYHEHARTDRDKYITIMWDNIPGFAFGDFKKYDQSVIGYFGQTYDYGSILHYSPYAFSITGYPTIVPKDPKAEIGQRRALSEKDIGKINNMYKCNM